MALYNYQCTICDKTYEIRQKMSDPQLEICPTCESKDFKRLIPSSLTFALRTGGFYATDHGYEYATTQDRDGKSIIEKRKKD